MPVGLTEEGLSACSNNSGLNSSTNGYTDNSADCAVPLILFSSKSCIFFFSNENTSVEVALNIYILLHVYIFLLDILIIVQTLQ